MKRRTNDHADGAGHLKRQSRKDSRAPNPYL